jgi:hypothetical protein
MSGVSFPRGIFSHAVSSVPSLSDFVPSPPSPLPIPFPNNPHFQPTDPCVPVLQQLFGFGDGRGDLLGVAPHTDLSLG